ncbi:hypothetical protein ES708_06770 [subsurface metagenome]
MVVHIMRPKCTGSTPKVVTIGKSIGVKSRMQTDPSMNIPEIIKNPMIIRRTTYTFVEIPVIKEVSA